MPLRLPPLALFLACLAGPLMAGPPISLLRDDGLGQGRVELVSLSQPSASLLAQPGQQAAKESAEQDASLFSGRAAGSLFEPAAPRARAPRRRAAAAMPRFAGTGVAGLRSLIAAAEAGPAGYDAIQHGARVRPRKRPTQMTIAEIERWIDATPGQPHAIGRYQFIPATLRRLVRALDVPGNARFTPAMQDMLADRLLAEAGLGAFLAGKLGRTQFMNNLARIWAGLPTSTGLSYYHGYAGNYATMTWAAFEAEMKRLF